MQPARLYSISEAARLLGVSSETLRRWDRKGRISIGRTPSGNRVFTEEEINLLKESFKNDSNQVISRAPQVTPIFAPKLPKIKSVTWFERFIYLGVLVIILFSFTTLPTELGENIRRKTSNFLISVVEKDLIEKIKEVQGKISIADQEILGDKEVLQASIGSLPLYSPTNLLINSSFEGGLTGYSIIGQSTNSNTKVGNESVRSGTQALRITDSSCINCQLGISQPKTTTINGRNYILSVYIRTKDLKGSPSLRIGLFGTVSSSDPIYLSRVASGEVGSQAYQSYSSDRYEDHSLSSLPSNEWIRLSSSFENLPLGKYPIIEVIDYTGGTIYIDDISLNEGVSGDLDQTNKLKNVSMTPYEENNIKLASNTVIADSFGNLYPSSPFVGTLGTKDNTFKSLYLDKLTINNGNLSTSGTIEGKSITSSSTTTSTFAGDLSITGNIDITGVYKKDGTTGKTVSTCGSSQYLGGIGVSGGIITTLGNCTTVSSKWSGLTDPDANLSLSMAAFTTTFTYNAATGTGNLFTLTDTASNTGTGYLLNLTTASSSTLLPFRVQARGNTIIDTTATGGVTIGNSTSAQAVTVDAGVATLNLGNSNNAKTINIGTGTAIDAINIGTGATGVDVISIGSSVASLALTDADWSITTGGAIRGTSLSVGTNPSLTGAIRVSNTGGLVARNAANLDDVDLIRSGTSNQIILGGGNAGSGFENIWQFMMVSGAIRWQIEGNGHLITGTDNAVDIGAAGATRPRTLYLGTSLAIGTNPAASGALLLPNNQSIVSRNAANNGDLFLIRGNPSNEVYVGPALDNVRLGGDVSIEGGVAGGTAATGTLRFRNAATIRWQNAGNTDNVQFSFNSSDQFIWLAAGGSTRMTLGNGLQIGGPTGGDKGIGTINVATNIFKNDSAYTNPDYAFEHYFTGSIVKFTGNEGASDYPGLLPLSDIEAYARQNYQLPRVGDKKGIFDRADIVLEKVEELFLYGFDHEKRITGLESSNKNLLTVVGIPQPSASSSATPTPSPSPTQTSSPAPIPLSILSRLDSLEKLVLSLSSLSVGGTGSASSLQASPSASFDNLTILKKLTTSDLGVTGKLANGLLSIDGLTEPTTSDQSPFASLNTLSNDLYLQNLGLGGINILAGKVLIDKDGNIKVENTIIAQKVEAEQIKIGSKSSGSGVFPANTLSLQVTAESATESARILLTPTTLTDKVLVVSKKEQGKFTVSVKEVEPQDIRFDWFIIQ